MNEPIILATAKAIRVTKPADPERYPNGYSVYVRCPFCGGVHQHGWRAPGGELLPRRLAHCHGSKKSERYWRAGKMEYDIDATEAEARGWRIDL